MNSYVNIKWTDDVDIFTRSLVEQLISSWEDFGYGYDLEQEVRDRICETLDDIGIEYEIVEDDDWL